ncbi:PKD domain-containing protein [Nocardioides sp. AE5]|uniref:PKD domain-containing protein n=1 Tax=Nocardioides sp. AE5 TaxID=2962573 RepID=UPI00288256B3|nr:PKD domain-containing protein [Nocardioides sp. AE5]MDT0203839.1 PKD domain-containing protein [Nocardioides sp. AE5]
MHVTRAHRATPFKRLRMAVVACAVLALTGALLSITSQPAKAYLGDFLGFGSNLEPSIKAGANVGIFADGAFSHIITCLPGGTNDFIFSVTDIYIVESGSATPFGDLVQADGTSPATIIGSGSSGAFIAELIAVTGPQGQLGEGTYDVVFDNCQDGKFTPTEDSIHTGVITVEFPAVLPPYNTWIGNLKAKAYKSAAIWGLTNRFMTALSRMREGEPPVNWGDVEAELPGVRVPLVDDIIARWEGMKSSLTPAKGPLSLFELAMHLAVNQGKHYNAIAEDPPDHDYQHSTVVPGFEVPLADLEFEPFANVQAIATTAASEGALSAAFLRSLERYQGATIANDAGWTLVHARELEDLATTLAAVNLQTAAQLEALLGSLDQLPEWDRIAADLQTFLGHQAWVGWTPEERQTMANLGMTSDDMVALASEMRAVGWEHSTNYWSMDRAQGHLGNHAAQQREMADELTALAARLRAVQAELEAQTAVPDDLPRADAGGPYAATAGGTLSLDGSGSAPGTDRTLASYAWDTDGDGVFDDATGANASVPVAADAPSLVGLRVTDDEGHTAVSYAPLAVDRGQVPTVGGVPESLTAVATVGEEFTLTPDVPAGASVTWFLGEDSYSTDPTLRITPDIDQVGVHSLELRVTDDTGRTARRTWYLAVLEPDADGDGWTVSADCNDDNPRINPGQLEIIGNRIDDDCDPGTPDLPLGSMPGVPVSWGSGDRLDGYGLGRQVNTTFPAEEPFAMSGLNETTLRIEGGDRMGLALTENGGLWSWGWGTGGQLGTGSNAQRSTATAVRDPSGTGQLGVDGPAVVDFDSNRISVAALEDGSAAAWGPNDDGVLGTGSTYWAVSTPTLVRGPEGDLTGVTAAASADAFLAFNSGGDLWVTGGACGTETTLTAQRVDGLPAPVVELAAGEGHLVVRLANGDLYGCGANDRGQLNSSGAYIDQPVPVEFGPDAGTPQALAAGDGFTVLLDEADRVWQVGADTAGPIEVELPDGPIITQVEAGADQAAVLRADGVLLRWDADAVTVTEVDLPEGMLVNQFALGAGDDFWYVVTTRSGATFAWGYQAGGGALNGQGQLPTPAPLPVQPFVDVRHAYHATIAIAPDGRVWSWGRREQRGEGEDVAVYRGVPGPVLAPGGQPGTQASAKRLADHITYGFNGLVTQDGRVAVWGIGSPMYFGDGSPSYRSSYYPVTVLTGVDEPLTGARQASLGQGHNLALLEDGRVMNWGRNPCLRGGGHFDAYATEFTEFGSDNRKVAVTASASLLLKRDGTLLACGAGETGHANNDRRPLREVPGMGPGEVADISTNMHQVLVLKTDGSVWTWRENQSPSQIEMPAGPRVVSLHMSRSDGLGFVIREDGSLLGWGGSERNLGQAGGGNTHIAEPTLISMPGNAPVYRVDGGYSGLSYDYFMTLTGDPLEHLAETVGVGIEATVADVTVAEGSVAQVEVSLNYPAGVDAEVSFATVDDTAVAGTDYVATTGTVTIPAGETSAVIEVPTIDDEVAQPGLVRDFSVEITEVSAWMMPGDHAAVVSITDDDPAPVVSVTGPGAPVVEGDVGSTEIEFVLSLDRPTTAETSVLWQTVDMSAQAPGDYVGGTGVVTFEPGQREAVVKLQVHGDTVLEPDEEFRFELLDPEGITLDAEGAVTVTIADDEPVLVEVSDQVLAVPVGETVAVPFTVSTPQLVAGESVVVPWSVSAPWQDGDPSPVGVTGSGSVTLTADEPSATVQVTVTGQATPQHFRVAAANLSVSGQRPVIADPGIGMVNPMVVQDPDPVAVVDGPATIDEGGTVTLSASGATGVAPLSFAWDIDGDGAYYDASGVSVDVVALAHGSLSVGLRVTDGNDRTATTNHTVTVANVAPVVAPIADQVIPTGSSAGLSVAGSFTDPGVNTWSATVDLGDGPEPLALDGKTFTVADPDPRAGPVTVRVCDDAGACDAVTFHVSIELAPDPPTAVITGPSEVEEGTAVTLSASESTGVGPLTFAWDTDGDGAYDDGTGPSIEVDALAHGSITVGLQVTDANDLTQTSTHTVTVSNVVPVLAPIPDQLLTAGVPLSVAGSFTDPGANVWTASVDFGDGPEPLDLDGRSFTITDPDPGAGPVTVTVCDDAQACDEVTFHVAIELTPPPVAQVTGPSEIDEGASGAYSAAPSTGTGTLVFAWDLDGDGVFDDATGEQIDVEFAAHGTKTIGLEVTDANGLTATETRMVTVNPVAPRVTVPDPMTVEPGEEWTGAGSFTDPGANTWTGTVDYGNGAQPLDLDGKTFELAHTWTEPGIYPVRVQVCDDADACGEVTVLATVPAPVVAPTITGIVPDQGPTRGGTRVLITGTGFVPEPTTADLLRSLVVMAKPSGPGGPHGLAVPGLSISFGSNAGTSIDCTTADGVDTCAVTTPAGAAGVVDVVLSTTRGAARVIDGFTYRAPDLPAPTDPDPVDPDRDAEPTTPALPSQSPQAGATGTTLPVVGATIQPWHLALGLVVLGIGIALLTTGRTNRGRHAGRHERN